MAAVKYYDDSIGCLLISWNSGNARRNKIHGWTTLPPPHTAGGSSVHLVHCSAVFGVVSFLSPVVCYIQI